jgi:hypothetical protein
MLAGPDDYIESLRSFLRSVEVYATSLVTCRRHRIDGCHRGMRADQSTGRAQGRHVERLYFGRNIGDTAIVSDSAWNGFVRTVLTPAFPEGATVWDAAGQWRALTGLSSANEASWSSSCTS